MKTAIKSTVPQTSLPEKFHESLSSKWSIADTAFRSLEMTYLEGYAGEKSSSYLMQAVISR